MTNRQEPKTTSAIWKLFNIGLGICCVLVLVLVAGSLLVRVGNLPWMMVIKIGVILLIVSIFGFGGYCLYSGKLTRGLLGLLVALTLIFAGIWIESVESVKLALLVGTSCGLLFGVGLVIFVKNRQGVVPPNTIAIQIKGENDHNPKEIAAGTKYTKPLNAKIEVIPTPQRHIKNKVTCFSKDEKSFEVYYSMYWQIKDEARLLLNWSKKSLPIEELMKDIADGMIGFQMARRAFADVRAEYDKIRVDAESSTKIYLENDLHLKIITFRLFLREISSQPAAKPSEPPKAHVIGDKPAP